MKINLSASNEGMELQRLLGLTLLDDAPVYQGREYVFDAKHVPMPQFKRFAKVVQRAFKDRCTGANPTGDKFVVTLKTRLASVSGALKIKPEDYESMKTAILDVVKKNPGAYSKYKANGFTDMRYNWDVLRASKFDIIPLYKYLNDAHINAALAQILKNTGKGASKHNY